MSHHYSGPNIGFPRGDARLDLTDLYTFPKPGDPDKSILIMNVHPSIGLNPPGPTTIEPFAPEARYELRIDTNGDAVANVTYEVCFSSFEGREQSATLRRVEGAQAAETGGDGKVIVEGVPVSTGHEAHVAQGGDHRFFASWRSDPFFFDGLGYANEMANRPRTLYGIADSPVGFAAWMLDHDAHSLALMSRVFDGKPEGLTRDDILDDITLYWPTNTAISSARLCWESKLAFFAPKHVTIPAAISAFPDELYQAPRSWTEQAYPMLIHYNKLDKGGHFAAWEQPELFAAELRAAFKSLR
jgi:hypothetical protein